ncbi:tyrosine-type recombinase/integrase [uncultured Bradyrhizobium sp.]|uniref:tyrosine-type recombinase/integrase n=1 Tax=uncultured Bradyrhizobium sp. TaxID=199684 RepID=UPI0035C97CFE
MEADVKRRNRSPTLYSAQAVRKYLNRAERKRALAIIAKLPPERALFAEMLAWTGARVSEVLALTPASFQIDSAVVTFRTLKRDQSCREVPIPRKLMAALNRQFRLRVLQHAPDLAVKRLWPWSRVTAWRCVKSIMSRAGIAGRQACPRGLRHSFGVGTVSCGVSLDNVQRLLGHASIETTTIYTDVSGPELRAVLARFWRSGG